MKTTLLRILACILLVWGVLTGCNRDDLPSTDMSNGVNLKITVSGMGSKTLNRAGIITSERTDRSRIEDMNIVLADANGNIEKIIYIDKATPSTPSIEEDGLVSGTLPTEDGTISYHIGTQSLVGVSQIFVVCNYCQTDANGNILVDKKNLNNCGIRTVEDLKAMKQQVPYTSAILTSALFGKAVEGIEKDGHGGQVYHCELLRTTAMVTVAITSGSGNERLKEGVKITPRIIRLHNVPIVCNLGIGNKIGENNVTGYQQGYRQQVGWAPLTSTNHGTTVGGHGNDPNIVPLFIFENLQGIMNNGNNEINKAPDKGKESDCSYLEVTADYLYVPQSQGDNQKYISGPIKYRLYLGDNITDDFNVRRNKHYQITLSLKGMGGLVEDGKTDSDGAYLGDGKDLSWRVESSGVEGGGSFLSSGLNMASNGFLSYVGFVGEEGHDYAIYCEGGVTNDNWLWSQCENLTGFTTPTEEFPAQIFSADQCGGVEGVSYIMLYAQPWIDDNDSWKTMAEGPINTVPLWIENGYRSANLILKDKTNNKEVAKFEARQWLPLPIAVDNSGNPITLTDPLKASFYYSRIDVYEGGVLPWGPEFYRDNWNAANLQTNNWTYYEGIPGAGGKKRSFNIDYGFDVITALYGTNPQAFTFQKDYGRPANALGITIFRAGNAVTSSGGSVSYSFNDLARIGLPTLKEWEKIMKYGIDDIRFGLANVPYWTTSMDGNKTYTYNPVTGAVQLEDRSEKRRIRLVYHKTDFAHKNN